MTNFIKRFVVGLAPAFALTALILCVILDKSYGVDGGEALLVPFLLSPVFAFVLAWGIGHLVFSMSNMLPRILIWIVIFLVGGIGVYLYLGNCNWHPGTCYRPPTTVIVPTVQP